MDAAGYDVAAMGAYEFAYGDASTGQKWHGNFTKFYTQKMLYEGLEDDFEYAKNGKGDVKGTLIARPAASFKVISSNIAGESAAQLDGAETTSGQGEKLFSFEQTATLDSGSVKVGFAAQTDSFGLDTLQDGLGNGLSMASATTLPEGADVIIGLSNDGAEVTGADFTVSAPTDGEEVVGALVVEPDGDSSFKVTEIPGFSLKGYADDNTVADIVSNVKTTADTVVATSDVTLVGKNTKHRYEESEMGDLVTDALLWYAENKFEGFEKDVPVVAIQNGGNIRKTIHKGDVIYNDIFNAYPYSPAGVGILYVTGEQLLESLEEANYANPSNALPHVAGMTYNLDLEEEYDASTTKGENNDGKYGNYFLADSYNRVSITSIGGKPFNPNATYAVVADNMVVANGLDTYGTFKSIKNSDGAKYLNNGTGVLVRDVVKKYLEEKCGGKMPAAYAQTQGRITFGDSNYKKAKAAMEAAKASGDAAKYMEAAEALAKEAAITGNPDKVTEAENAVKDAQKEGEDLAAAKIAAKKELDKVDLKKYKQPELSAVKNAIADGKKKIDAASDIKAVNNAKTAALKAVDKQAKYNSKLPKVTVNKPKKASKAFTAKWKKLSKAKRNKITGIEIQYARDKKFTKSAKMVKAKKTATSKKISKLAKKKQYWVRVRTYKTKNGVKTVSAWSTPKRIKTK